MWDRGRLLRRGGRRGVMCRLKRLGGPSRSLQSAMEVDVSFPFFVLKEGWVGEGERRVEWKRGGALFSTE